MGCPKGVFRGCALEGPTLKCPLNSYSRKWNPVGALGGALLFGFADALQIKLQIVGVKVAYQFLGMTPYVVTMIVLAGVIVRAVPPAALGMPYEKDT